MLPVCDLVQDDPATLHEAHELARVRNRHGGVVRALQDHDRAPRIERPARQQMLAPLLDQTPRDGVGLAVLLRDLGLDAILEAHPERKLSRNARPRLRIFRADFAQAPRYSFPHVRN